MVYIKYMYVNRHVELAQWGNSAIENLCIIIIMPDLTCISWTTESHQTTDTCQI